MTSLALLQSRLVRCACLTVVTALTGGVATVAMAQAVPLASMPPVAQVRVPDTPQAPDTHAALATPTSAPAEPMAISTPMEAEWKPALKVGEATSSLLALQASGVAGSRTTRPVPGEIAGRSYQRYLKSFEYPIPEKFGTTVKNAGTASGGQ